ncbi:GNAT family N-acetyltransferase [Actinopolyspora erythraea]|uniref:GNAT family N-acetyltransferase n=1 Tax=Actinopolyspora erythraea TaxID=414996 RepID=A0A099D3Z7_9ACTN|nr:GNAT family N-acetyltransferase [Actinopolyspora erythraea]ASU79230.1 GNAT family N-acetyltransferase [Actinopolyspora erythraea]KGI80794.1 hypothetical protein IL38_15695 [Actinopolyspora erythraea]
MTEHDVRPLVESEYRAAHDLFRAALHMPAATDSAWWRMAPPYEFGRVWGDHIDGALAGTAMAFPSSVVLPGGAELPAAAVTAVGVRADRTRRGVLTHLMRAQLNEAWQEGEAIAMLHASETPIYGRFGYGVATRARTVRLEKASAKLREDAPGGGEVRLVDPESARELLPGIYRGMPSRAGMISRPSAWWETRLRRDDPSGEPIVIAVHRDESGDDDGFAIWTVHSNDPRFGDGRTTLRLLDMCAASSAARCELWRFLLGIDLVDEVVAIERPLDEPLEWWLTDSRQCRVRDVYDDLWVRPVDVTAALRGRDYGGSEAVVLEVRDTTLPHNEGRYLVGPDGVERVEREAQLSLDVALLAPLLFGEVASSTLADANLLAVHDPAALSVADALFATGRYSWCGTHF